MSGPPLAGKVVVVTGATSGIGRATALACSRQGARLMAVGRKGAALESLAEACAGWGGELRSIALDVTEDEAMETIASDALDAFGRIDAWVNNAAVYAVGLFEQTPPEAFERVLAVNLQAAVRGSRVALAQFRAQGEGVLINVSSMVAGLPGPTVSAYAAAKWGLRGFSLALHAELRDEPGIDVCVVRPSSIDTPIFRQTANYSGRRVKALTPTYAPEQAARAIAGLITKPRRELVVGRSGKALAAARHLAPGLVDRIFATRSVRDQFDGDEPAELTDGNLYEPDERWDDVTGGWRERAGGIAAGARAGPVANAAQVSPPRLVGHPSTRLTTLEAKIMGLKDEVTGKAKEAEGKLTDDKSREAEGQLDQAKGNAKDALDDVKDAAKS